MSFIFVDANSHSSTVRTRAIASARIFAALVEPHWFTDPQCQQDLATAIALGKPVCLLTVPGVRLPETTALGARDLRCFAIPSTADGAPDFDAAASWLKEQVDSLIEEGA